jgi:microcystin-dependent protein
MGQPYIGEIRMFAGNFAPQGWAFCDGAIVPIAQNDALFQLIGTTYGGDGQTTFALPDLVSPVHVGPGFNLGQKGGAETVTLTVQQLPVHSHLPQAGGAGSGNTATPASHHWAPSTHQAYSTSAPASTMSSSAVGNTGGAQPHNNVQPYLAVNFIISLFGIFPSQ